MQFTDSLWVLRLSVGSADIPDQEKGRGCTWKREPRLQPLNKKAFIYLKHLYDSIEHTFIECPFTRSFAKKVIQWFNEANCCQISTATEELLLGIISNSKETKLINKFNYTTLSVRHYIYSNKINSKRIYLQEFVNKLSLKYNLENIN